MRHTCHPRDPGRDDHLTLAVMLGPTLVLGKWSPNWRLEAGNTAPVCYLHITDDELSESANLSDGGVAVLMAAKSLYCRYIARRSCWLPFVVSEQTNSSNIYLILELPATLPSNFYY